MSRDFTPIFSTLIPISYSRLILSYLISYSICSSINLNSHFLLLFGYLFVFHSTLRSIFDYSTYHIEQHFSLIFNVSKLENNISNYSPIK